MQTTHPTRVILLLQADVDHHAQLRLSEEARRIRSVLKGARHRSRFRLETRAAVRRKDFLDAVLDLQPSLVHFCGHANPNGLIIEGDNGSSELARAQAVADFFGIFQDRIRCVVLNACSTALQAEMISKHIDFVIGTRTPLEDHAALDYAESFYQALGGGSEIRQAHRIACNALTWTAPKPETSPYQLLIRESATEPFVEEPPALEIDGSELGNLLLALRDLEIEDVYLLAGLIEIRRADLGSGNIFMLAVSLKERALIEGKIPWLVQELCHHYPQIAQQRNLLAG